MNQKLFVLLLSLSFSADAAVLKRSDVVFMCQADRDSVEPLRNVTVRLNLAALGVPKATSCRLVTPDAGTVHLRIESDSVTVPMLGLWGLLALENQ
jgi:hypothetical protein